MNEISDDSGWLQSYFYLYIHVKTMWGLKGKNHGLFMFAENVLD